MPRQRGADIVVTDLAELRLGPMIRHEPVLPPEDIFPIHDWRVVETRLNLEKIAQTETIFATANGYPSMRGAFEEGGPAGQHGTFINGFYESWPIPCEGAFGFATHGQTIVNVPDAKIIRDDAISYRLEQGDDLTFWHRDEEIVLRNGQSQQRDL